MPIGLLRPVFLASLCAVTVSAQSLKIGEPAPPLILEQTVPSGVQANWASLKGKPVVLEFWATWCGNCVAEIGHLNELISQFDAIQFLSISDEPISAVAPFLAKQPIRGWVGLDREGTTFKTYGVVARPQTILVDGNGVVRAILHPAQVTAAVLADFVANRPVKAYGLPARLHIMEDAGTDPVFAMMLRPSSKTKPGGIFALDSGKLEGDNLFLKTILAWAFSVGERHLEGPEALLNTRYDVCVLLPAGLTGDRELLRDMLERSFRLKVRREQREMDAVVLKLAGERPPSVSDGRPLSILISSLEFRLKRMVSNETGMDGRFEFFELPEKTEDLAAVLRTHLGIEMSFARRPVEMLVIESMELPTFRVSLPGR
jgi:peroxiredoxin